MLDVAIKGIRFGEPALDGDKLALWIALEGDEEEAGVDLARAWFGRFRERVAAAQDALAAIALWTRESDVRVVWNRRLAAVATPQIDGSNSSRRTTRRILAA